MSSKRAARPHQEEIDDAIRAPWQWIKIWHQGGACYDSDRDWFDESVPAQRELARICTRCPVRKQCLSFALETGQHCGVWGGLTERELRKAAALTPQGTRQLRPGVRIHCPWCRAAAVFMTATPERVVCGECGFEWPGLVESCCPIPISHPSQVASSESDHQDDQVAS